MNYGEIFADTLKLIWRRKKLWVIAWLGSALMMVAMTIYMISIFGVQSIFLPMVMSQAASPEELGAMMSPAMLRMGIVLVLSALFFVVSYFINLIARGGGISEAGAAWEGDAVYVRRGLDAGLRKAPTLFLLDLLWGLPSLLLGVLSLVLMASSFAPFFSALQNGGDMDGDAAFRVFGSLMGGAMLIVCLGWLYSIFRGIFSPLMYQSAVIGRKSLRAAIAEGWRLALSHIGPMFIFWLLLLATSLAMGVVMQVLLTPLSMLLMGPWMQMMNSLDSQAPVAAPGPASWILTGVVGLGFGVIMWLSMSLLQAITLTLYARVYQELRQDEDEAASLAPED